MVEIADVLIADCERNVPDGKRGLLQKLARVVEADILHIFLESQPSVFLQDQIKIIPVIVELLLQSINCDVRVVEADVSLQLVEERFFLALPTVAAEDEGIVRAEPLQKPDELPAPDVLISRQTLQILAHNLLE